jgi:hypothetical protein
VGKGIDDPKFSFKISTTSPPTLST